MIKQGSIYKDDKGFVLFPMSKTLAGFLVSTEPGVRIYNTESEEKIAPALFNIFGASKEGVANPVPITNAEKLELKKKAQKFGLNSFESLNKRPFLRCAVKLDGEVISITPSLRDSKGKGYVSKETETIYISSKAANIDILNAIEVAFQKCE